MDEIEFEVGGEFKNYSNSPLTGQSSHSDWAAPYHVIFLFLGLTSLENSTAPPRLFHNYPFHNRLKLTRDSIHAIKSTQTINNNHHQQTTINNKIQKSTKPNY
jgi:hypothetical protein